MRFVQINTIYLVINHQSSSYIAVDVCVMS